MQPSNPETWLTLGEYDLKNNPRAAVAELRAAVYLNPESIAAQNAYVQALRASPRASAAKSQTSLTGHAGVALPTDHTGIVREAAQNRLR